MKFLRTNNLTTTPTCAEKSYKATTYLIRAAGLGLGFNGGGGGGGRFVATAWPRVKSRVADVNDEALAVGVYGGGAAACECREGGGGGGAFL